MRDLQTSQVPGADLTLPTPPAREPGETEEDYRDFLVYISCKPGERTAVNLAGLLGIPVSDVVRKATAFNWVDRARTYDRAVLEVARTATARSIQSAAASIAQAVEMLAERIRQEASSMELTASSAARLLQSFADFFRAATPAIGEEPTSRGPALADILQVINVVNPSGTQPVIIRTPDSTSVSTVTDLSALGSGEYRQSDNE